MADANVEKRIEVCSCGATQNVWINDVVINASQKNDVNSYKWKCRVCKSTNDFDIPVEK